MVTIPQSLQQRRPFKPPTVAQMKPQIVRTTTSSKLQTDYDLAVKQAQQINTINEYKTFYDNLSPELKPYFETPSNVSSTATQEYYIGNQKVSATAYGRYQKDQQTIKQIETLFFKATTGNRQAKKTLGLEKRYGSSLVKSTIQKLEAKQEYKLQQQAQQVTKVKDIDVKKLEPKIEQSKIFEPTKTEKVTQIPQVKMGGSVYEPVTRVEARDIETGSGSIKYYSKGKQVKPEVKITNLGEFWKDKIVKEGKGSFTAAVNVGNGYYQDVVISYSGGKVSNLRPLDSPIYIGKDIRQTNKQIMGKVNVKRTTTYQPGVSTISRLQVQEEISTPTGITPGITGIGFSPIPLKKGEKYSGTLPTWEIISDNNPLGWKQIIDKEVKYASESRPFALSSVTQTELSKGQYVTNLLETVPLTPAERRNAAKLDIAFDKKIKELSKELKTNPEKFIDKQGVEVTTDEKGNSYVTLTPDFLRQIPEYKAIDTYNAKMNVGFTREQEAADLNRALNKFKQLPKKVKLKSSLAELELAGGKVAEEFKSGYLSYLSAFGTKKINEVDPRQKVNPIAGILREKRKNVPTVPAPMTFGEDPFGRVSYAIKNQPYEVIKGTVIAEGLISLGSQGAANVKKYGFVTGVKESAVGFLPVKFARTEFPLKEQFVKQELEGAKPGFRTIVDKGGSKVYTEIMRTPSDVRVNRVTTETPTTYGFEGKGNTIINVPKYTYVGGKLTQGFSPSKVNFKYTSSPYLEGYKTNMFSMTMRGNDVNVFLDRFYTPQPKISGNKYSVDIYKYNPYLIDYNLQSSNYLTSEVGINKFIDLKGTQPTKFSKPPVTPSASDYNIAGRTLSQQASDKSFSYTQQTSSLAMNNIFNPQAGQGLKTVTADNKYTFANVGSLFQPTKTRKGQQKRIDVKLSPMTGILSSEVLSKQDDVVVTDFSFTGTTTKQGSRSGQRSITSVKPVIEPVTIPVNVPVPRVPVTRFPTEPDPLSNPSQPGIFPIRPPLPKGSKYRRGTMVGYETLVKERGKFKKVSDRPLTRNAAQDLGARIVDNTISSTYKIQPIKKTVVKQGKKVSDIQLFTGRELQRGDGYFANNQQKFRGYQVSRRMKKPISNTWIERERYRIDTPGEQKGLSIAGFKSNNMKRLKGGQGFFGFR